VLETNLGAIFLQNQNMTLNEVGKTGLTFNGAFSATFLFDYINFEPNEESAKLRLEMKTAD